MSKNNVLHELETVCVMDLLLDGFILYGDGLLKMGALVEEFTVVGLMRRELEIVAHVRVCYDAMGCSNGLKCLEYTIYLTRTECVSISE